MQNRIDELERRQSTGETVISSLRQELVAVDRRIVSIDDKVEGLNDSVKGLCVQFSNKFDNLADLIISTRQSTEPTATLPKQHNDSASSINSSTSSADSKHSRSSIPVMPSPDAKIGWHNNVESPMPSHPSSSPQFIFNFSGAK